MSASLSSKRYEVDDLDEALEFFHRKGWTDGLPVVPPTPARVAAFIERSGRSGSEQIGFYEARKRPITIEKLAINAVMAGCRPEYMPVVIAIVEAMMEPKLNVHVANSSTGSLAMGFIVNGPIRHKLGMNYRGNALGPGNRANASIGRAIRLIQINVMGSIGGAGAEFEHGLPVLDRSTMGQPAKYTGYHVVENEEDFPSLTPLHVELGFAPTDSTVTVFAPGGHVMLSNHVETTPEEWLDSVAKYLLGRLVPHGYGVLLLSPEAATLFVNAGWTKADIRQGLFERTRRSAAWLKENKWKIGGRNELGGPVLPGDEKQMLAIAGTPEQIYVVVCGGPAGNYPFFIYAYSKRFGEATRKIRDV